MIFDHFSAFLLFLVHFAFACGTRFAGFARISDIFVGIVLEDRGRDVFGRLWIFWGHSGDSNGFVAENRWLNGSLSPPPRGEVPHIGLGQCTQACRTSAFRASPSLAETEARPVTPGDTVWVRPKLRYLPTVWGWEW